VTDRRACIDPPLSSSCAHSHIIPPSLNPPSCRRPTNPSPCAPHPRVSLVCLHAHSHITLPPPHKPFPPPFFIGEDPDDTQEVIRLLEGCIEACFHAAAVIGETEDSPVVVPSSLAHTWLAKIKEQQQQDDDDDVKDGPADDSGGPLLAEAAAHYETALACW
jgi:hypothetical protein